MVDSRCDKVFYWRERQSPLITQYYSMMNLSYHLLCLHIIEHADHTPDDYGVANIPEHAKFTYDAKSLLSTIAFDNGVITDYLRP